MKLFRNYIINPLNSITSISYRSLLNTSKISTLYIKTKDDQIVSLLKRRGKKYYKSIKFKINSDYSLLHQIVYDNRKDLFEKSVISIPFFSDQDIINDKDNKLSISPLELSTITNNSYFFQSLIDLGANIHVKNSYGDMTLLHLAAYKNSVRILNLLLNVNKQEQQFESFNIENKTTDGQTALHISCQFGNIDSTNLLIESGSNLYSIDSSGFTPIERACLNDKIDLFKILYENYYSENKLKSINFGNKKYVSLTHLASTCSTGVNVLTYLANNTEKINSLCDHFNSSPLHFAILQKNINAVNLLLSKGAIVNIKDYLGNTPLHYATEIGNINIIRSLINYGGNINVKNNSGLSPYNIAMNQDHREIYLYFISISTQKVETMFTEEDFKLKESKKFD